MAKSHNIDCNRIFLFGTSGPGRAAALHAGYTPDVLHGQGQVKPYWLYIGENEQIFSIAQAREIGKSRAALGQPNDLIIIPDHDHWFYAIGPQITEDAWRWFAAMTR